MNFDNAKENIQPLACGRDAKRLEIALNAELNEEAQQELQRQKCEFEAKLQNYCGDDPLENWFEYILWVEQCYPKSGKECAIDELLRKCLLQFGSDSKYFQDGRFIKLYIKFIDTQENPVEIYQQLYNHGIGTMVADFYIGWAYYYDLMDNYNKANDVYLKGIDARAQPLEDLEQAQKTFSLSIPARMLSRDENDKRLFRSTMEEKRNALTSLRAHKHKHVGSLRTGNVIKSTKPGKLSSSTAQSTSKSNDNRLVPIFQDTLKNPDECPHFANQTDTSITHSLIDKARDKENKKEPGPWSKSNKNHNRNVIEPKNVNLPFSIMEDENLGLELVIKLPPDFKRANLPQTEYLVPLFYSEERAFTLPRYDKIMVYPGDGNEYSPEEIRAWRYFKKHNVQNQFVARCDEIWTNEKLNLRLRIPPNFPKRNKPQTEFLTEPQPAVLSNNNQRLHFRGWTSYVYAEDLTVEDYLIETWQARRKNKTVVMNMSLDETTICEVENSILMIDDTKVVIEETCDAVTEAAIASPAAKKSRVSPPEKLPFQVYTDENNGESLPASEIPPPKPITIETDFKIFTDDEEVVFKEPKYTGAIKKSNVKPQEMESESKGNELVGFATEETFSTQNFVMFIKQHETSTPVQNKKRPSSIPTQTEHEKPQLLSKIPVKVIPHEIVSSPESEIIPKELSVIMETSETNTNSNTKSSVEENDSSKYLFNCNQTTKSKTIAQNLSTIHENSCPRDPSGVKDSSKFATLGLSGLKLTDDSVTLPKGSTTRELCCEVDELCELFSKTPEKVIKNIPMKPECNTHQKSKKSHNSLENDLLDFFKKSPKKNKKPFLPVTAPSAPIVLNDSVTIPSFKDILLTNKCDATATTTNLTTDLIGASLAMPKNQSIMPEFTENISVFAHKSKLNSFTVPPQLNNENSDLIRFSSKAAEISFEDVGKSIYEPRQIIDDADNFDDDYEAINEPTFQHRVVDLNQTRQQIETCVTAENIDPWNVDLHNAFLEDLDFFSYLEKQGDCALIYNVPSLKGLKSVEIAGKLYNSLNYLSKGSFGYIYRGKDAESKQSVVLKQERPPNCWEYYIAIIITERIFIEFLPRFVVIQSALIGNNSSIFVSDYVPYGTLIDVCNKVYAATSRHLDELVVMVLAIEIFTIVDLLHSADIIHGDIKPDNFLLLGALSLDSNRPLLKLIDYGNSIDMQRFPPNTTFNTAVKTEDFVCSEMKEGRPWTYQTDLYCVAATIHVLLFGHYMKTENKLGKVTMLSKMPRYFHKPVWERIFTSLLNVPDCRTFPNLQDFKLDLKEILAENNKLVLDKIGSFNRIVL